MKKILYIPAALGLLFLIFTHPAAVAAGCSRGLTLWYTSVLPSLLPFLILSGLLIRSGMFHSLNRIYAPVLSRIFRISEESCYAVLIGFLCGFPMGAKTINELVTEEHISKEEGEYLLGFCNNVSPAFFLNYICFAKSGYTEVPWKLFSVFYAVPILYGIISRFFYDFTVKKTPKKQVSLRLPDFPMLDTCIMDSFMTITRLGGYIILFSILVRLSGLLPLSGTALAFLSAAMELSCGIDKIASLSLPTALQTALLCTSAAFGGFCICAQTSSVLEDSPLSVRTWLTGRVIIALLTFPVVLYLPVGASDLRGCW